MNISFLKETYNYLILLLISAVLLTSGCEKTNFDKDKLKCEVKTVEGSPISVVGTIILVKVSYMSSPLKVFLQFQEMQNLK